MGQHINVPGDHFPQDINVELPGDPFHSQWITRVLFVIYIFIYWNITIFMGKRQGKMPWFLAF
jgi:hypothetical protein